MTKLTKEQLSLYYALSYYKNDFPMNIGGILTFKKNISNDKIKNTLEILIRNSSNMRTVFYENNNQINQKILNNLDFEVDLLPNTDKSTIDKYFLEPFELGQKMFKVAIVNTDQKHLIIVMSHLISDGYTFNLLTNNFLNILANKEAKKYDSHQIILEQEEIYYNSPKNKKDIIFWQNNLKGYQTIIKPNTFKKGINLAKVKSFIIPEYLTKKIKEYLKINNHTIQTFISGIIALELAFVNGSNEISLGITIHNRNGKTKNVLGMLAMSLPLNFKLEKSFLETLNQIKIRSLNSYKHRSLGYDEIMKIHTEKYQTKMFDTLIIYHQETNALNHDFYEYNILRDNKTDLNLTINIYDRFDDKEYLLVNVFNAALFTDTIIDNFHQRIISRIERVVNKTDFTSDLLQTLEIKSLNKQFEVDNILNILNKSFKENAVKTALNNGVRLLTYKELEKLSDGVANRLIALKIDSKVVLIDLEDDIKRIIALLGVIKSNNSFSFLIKNEKNIDNYMEIVGASYLINDNFFDEVNDFKPRKYLRINKCLAVYPTSGTTNVYKAVKLSDQGVINYVCQKDYFWHELNEIETIINLAEFTFDISLENIMLTLVYGKTIHLTNLEKLINFKGEVDFLSTTPSVIKYILASEVLTTKFKKLKVLVLGGEILSKSLVNEINEKLKVKIFNSYGPTEASIAVTTKQVEEQSITLGKPLKNVEIGILNKKNQPLPIGYIGNISIGGIALMLGYVNENQNPFVKLNGQKYYLTNDLGYIDENGELNYLGRLDCQVKRNGVRIELALIDNILSNHLKIQKSQTIFVNNKIVSYFIGELDQSEIFNYLKDKLPKNYLPNEIIPAKNYSFNQSGKLVFEKIVNDNLPLVPKSLEQEIIFNNIKTILKVNKITKDDNFITLGGDSIKALLLIINLSEAGINLPLTLFQANPPISNYDQYIIKKVYNDSPIKTKKYKFYKSKTLKKPRRVLLLGATGFLGMHLLKELVSNDFEVTVLIRSKDSPSIKDRINSYYQYYFGEDIDLKITIIEARITNDNLGLNNEKLLKLLSSVDCIINSAGKVDFIGNENDFDLINFKMVKNLTEISKKYSIMFYHISTTGIALSETEVINETSYYQNEIYDNYYLSSKRKAEDYLLEQLEVNDNIYLLRVGNIMPRISDYKFQINPNSNLIYQYVRNNKSFKTNLGLKSLDVTPVCELSTAIIKLVINPPNLSVLHLYNSDLLQISKNSNQYKISNQLTNEILETNNFKFKKLTTKYLKEVFKLWTQNK